MTGELGVVDSRVGGRWLGGDPQDDMYCSYDKQTKAEIQNLPESFEIFGLFSQKYSESLLVVWQKKNLIFN